ncbi:hypothetical protein V3390_03400 [Luteimonas sp. FXH3W]|uniref:Lipoprotein n=1 Tax=Aquilutibacter rugosus TaxID=3115820 RepID=A0ABU7UYE0_9GAMM
MTRKFPRILQLTAMAFAVVSAGAGCQQQAAQTDEAQPKAQAQAKGQAINGMTAIAPSADAIAAAKLNYSPYEPLGTDGVLVVPSIDPKFRVGLQVDVPGNYEISLAQDKCTSGVKVDLSKEPEKLLETSVLTLAAPKITFKHDSGATTQLQIEMQAGAQNNWFCNVMVRRVG